MKKQNRLLPNIFFYCCMLCACTCFVMQAQFSPLSDTHCQVLMDDKEGTTWNSSYMWYPGQLAAHKQAMLWKKSNYRCVNVDYPGTYMEAVDHAIFRKKIELPHETQLSWETTGTVAVRLNGQIVPEKAKTCIVPAGKCLLEAKVQTKGKLPALIVKGEHIQEVAGWEVSIDGENWYLVETDMRYNNPGLSPNAEQESSVVILPDKYITIRNAEIQGKEMQLGENGGVLIDFRHLELGNVQVCAKGTGRLSFKVGESPEEALADGAIFEQRIIRSYPLTPDGQNIVLPDRALRYVYITCDRPCTLSGLRFVAKTWPVEFQMQFKCDDEMLNAIWNAGVATLHTTLHDFYLDGVKRDFLPWPMDAVVSAMGGDYAFGERQATRNGLSIALLPPNPQQSDLGIMDYPLHALLGLKSEYLRYGDLHTSFMFKERIVQQMAFYEALQDEKGFIWGAPPTWGFVPCWHKKMGPDDYGAPTYAQILLYMNFRIAAYFARLWRENGLADHYAQKAEELEESIVDVFWDAEQKAFINGYFANEKLDNRISHHAQYWGILSGLYPSKHYDYLFDELIPSIPFYYDNISYEKGYEFLAYFKAGRRREVFDMLDSIWGDWLRQGNTRFPENFLPKAPLKEQLAFYGRPFGLSLCHSANGVVPILAVLYGIYGFSCSNDNLAEYTLRPDLLHLNYVDGRIPIKEGYIGIHLKKEGMCSIEIPDGCIVHLYPNTSTRKPLVWEKEGVYTFEIE